MNSYIKQKINTEAPQTPKTVFFYIKKQHTHRNFYNHPYFSLKSKEKSYISTKEGRAFVDTPTQFGIQPLYQHFARQSQLWWKNSQSNSKQRLSTTSDHYLKTKTSHKQKKYQNSKQLPKVSQKLSKLKQNTQSKYKMGAEHRINIIFSSNIKSYQQIAIRKLQINILKYIVNCFIKCKINFELLNQEEVNQILRMIKVCKAQPPSKKFSAEDVVNIKSMSQLFAYLKQFPQRSPKWLQIVRYFFLKEINEADTFQLCRLKQQLKNKFETKLDIKMQKQYQIYRSDNGKKVQNLYELLQFKTFLLDNSKNCHSQFSKLNQGHMKKFEFLDRVNKWKSKILRIHHQQSTFVTTLNPNFRRSIQSRYSIKKIVKNLKRQTKSLKFSSLFHKQAFNQSNNIFQ